MKTLALVVGIFSFAAPSAFARNCADVAGRAAKSIDSISNSTSLRRIEVASTQKIKSERSGGETLDTYQVNLVADEDMASVYEVALYSTDCIIQNVRHVTGD